MHYTFFFFVNKILSVILFLYARGNRQQDREFRTTNRSMLMIIIIIIVKVAGNAILNINSYTYTEIDFMCEFL